VSIRNDTEPVELNISPATVCFIIGKARMFDEEGAEPIEPADEEERSPVDVEGREARDEFASDSIAAELRETIDDLNEDEVVDLIALAWVGRGDFSREEWAEARSLAEQRHRRHSADYLMGMPALGDLLEEGLAAVGHSCEGA
jgi:hypothetical protein